MRRTLIVLVLGIACIAGATWAWLAPQRRDRAVAQDFLRRWRESKGCASDYANNDRLPWRSLASAERPLVRELLRQLRQEVGPDHLLRICPQDLGQLLGIALGVDHDGSRSRAMLSEFVIPALEAKRELPDFVRWVLGSPRLRIDPTMVPRLFDLELRRIEDGRQIVIFHERSHPTEYSTLERWAGELVANSAAKDVRRFVPRLLAVLRNHGSPAAGTLNTSAPLLSPDEASTALSTALQMDAGFGLYGEWHLGALVQRLTSLQAGPLIPVILGGIERQSLGDLHGIDAVSRAPSWGDVLAGLADRLDPAQHRQVGLAALRLLAKEDEGVRLSILTVSLLGVLGSLEREQVAPVLRQWLERLPTLISQSEIAQGAFIMLGEHAAAWLDKADPADVSRAARRIRDVMVANRSSVSSYVVEAFGAWAPLLTPEDAFDIAESLAKAHPQIGVGKLPPAIEKFSQRLSSRQLLAIAQILAPCWQTRSASAESNPTGYGAWLHGRLAVCLNRLGQRMDEQDRLSFEAKWGTKAFSSGDFTPPSESEQEVKRDQETIRELAHGTALPSAQGDPSAYVQALLGFWLHEWDPVRRSILIREMVRATSAVPMSLTLAAYPRPISAAQLYLDLLKDHQVDADDWQVLVRALRTSAQRPPDGSLWDYLAWTQQDPSGCALGLDWVSQPPWWQAGSPVHPR